MQRLRSGEVRQAIEHFLELVGERGNVPADLDALARVLDRLALAGSVESPEDALELGEVAWMCEHANGADALTHLRFTFRIHWGEHLRGLQWVLHMQRRDSA